MATGRNLLIVLASGLRSDALDDERVWPLQTPNLRRLARRGVRMVATSACPAEPGGAISLLTGLHARQHGRVAPGDSTSCLPGLSTWLVDAGYHVVGVGALGPFASTCARSVLVESVSAPQPQRCDYFRQMTLKGLGPALSSQRRQRLRAGPFEPDRLLLEPDDDPDGFIALEARRAAAEMPSDRPWALIVVFTGPGNDLPPPPPYDELIAPEAVVDGFLPADLRRLDVLAEPAYPRIMLQRLEPAMLARIRADYLGRVGLIDRGVGRILDAVNARPDRGRTWTVFGSDMGYLLGEHGLVGRQSFLAGAVETPVIVSSPVGAPLPSRAEDEALLSTTDVAVTAAVIAGADPPTSVTGRSLLPLWQDDGAVPPMRGGILSEFNGRLLLETERHKAVFDVASGACIGIFDLLNDPDERRNLGEDHVGRNLVDALRLRVCDALLPLRSGPR